MSALLEDNKSAEIQRDDLTQHLMDAFVDDFKNGSGRKAVYHYLDAISNSARHLENGSLLAAINLMHVSSSTIYHSFGIIGSPTVTTRSHSDKSSSIASRKRKRGDSGILSPPPSTIISTSEAKGKTDQSKESKKGNCYCDLVVATTDIKSEEGKYLLLVEVLSHGVHMNSAERKMLKQMICCIQSQKEVYGTIFSATDVYLLRAKNGKDNDKPGHVGQIIISRKMYTMYDSDHQFNVLNVGHFQEMTMDIFSILVYRMVKLISKAKLN